MEKATAVLLLAPNGNQIFASIFFTFPIRPLPIKRLHGSEPRVGQWKWRAVVRKDWLVLATDHWPNEEEFESQWQELHRLAEELGGEYDGYGGPG